VARIGSKKIERKLSAKVKRRTPETIVPLGGAAQGVESQGKGAAGVSILHPTKWQQDIDSGFLHSVDLVPPEDGFPDAV
jgi:hypothetical protein